MFMYRRPQFIHTPSAYWLYRRFVRFNNLAKFKKNSVYKKMLARQHFGHPEGNILLNKLPRKADQQLYFFLSFPFFFFFYYFVICISIHSYSQATSQEIQAKSRRVTRSDYIYIQAIHRTKQPRMHYNTRATERLEKLCINWRGLQVCQ